MIVIINSTVSERPSTSNSVPKWNITFPKEVLNTSRRITYVPNPGNLRNECEKYGGSYEEASKAAYGLPDCIHVAIGPKFLESNEVLNGTCNNLPLLKKCSKNYIAVMNTCSDPKVRENYENLEKFFEESLNFVCANKSDAISGKSNIVSLSQSDKIFIHKIRIMDKIC